MRLVQSESAQALHAEQGTEEEDSVDALASLEGPGGFPDMEPHGELVEGEGCTHAVENGDEATGKEGDGRGVGANLGDEGVAADEQQQDAPDEMVDVVTAENDPSEGAEVEGDADHKQAHADESEEEAEGGEEEAAAGAVGDALVEDAASAGEVQQKENGGCAGCQEEQKDPGRGPVHHDQAQSVLDERAVG